MEISSGRAVSLQSGHQPQFLVGLDAGKSSTPGIGDTYYATDISTVYVCFAAGVWSVQGGTSGYYRNFWQKQGTVVQGTWVWTADASQTNYATITSEAAGVWINSSNANLDEYKWSNIFLSPGDYKLTLYVMKGASWGILEVLFGNTSLGTFDLYNTPATLYNQTTTMNFTISAATTADLRFRVNGKNAGSSGYAAAFSRLQIEKTA